MRTEEVDKIVIRWANVLIGDGKYPDVRSVYSRARSVKGPTYQAVKVAAARLKNQGRFPMPEGDARSLAARQGRLNRQANEEARARTEAETPKKPAHAWAAEAAHSASLLRKMRRSIGRETPR